MFLIEILYLNDPYFQDDPKSGFVIKFASFRRYWIDIQINVKSNYVLGPFEVDPVAHKLFLVTWKL